MKPVGRPLAEQLHYAAAAMTRFDRLWEPLCFVLAFAVVWFGTL